MAICECGCGDVLTGIDREGYPQRFVRGHVNRGRKFPNVSRTSAFRRFFAKVEFDTNGCWLWCGGLSKGYPIFHPDVPVRAHRWSYETFVGKIEEGKTLDHLCRTRRCVNPLHLEPVSQAENNRREHARRKISKYAVSETSAA